MDYLKKPLTIAEIKERLEENSAYITGIISIDLKEIINNNDFEFVNILSEKLTGGRSLTNITYEPVGISDDKMILIKVRGKAFDIINKYEDIDD